jgi:hypothetical protein
MNSHDIRRFFGRPTASADEATEEQKATRKQDTQKRAIVSSDNSSSKPNSDQPSGIGAQRADSGASGAPAIGSKDMSDQQVSPKYVAITFANNGELAAVLDQLLSILPQADIDMPSPTTLIARLTELELAKKVADSLKFSYELIPVRSPGNRSFGLNGSPLDTEEGLLRARRELEAKRGKKRLQTTR